MESRKWQTLARYTLDFIAVANENGFCLDILQNIKRRLYCESPYPIHHKKEEQNNECKNYRD